MFLARFLRVAALCKYIFLVRFTIGNQKDTPLTCAGVGAAMPDIGTGTLGASDSAQLRFLKMQGPALSREFSAIREEFPAFPQHFTPRLPRIRAFSSSSMAELIPSTSSAFKFDMSSARQPNSHSSLELCKKCNVVLFGTRGFHERKNMLHAQRCRRKALTCRKKGSKQLGVHPRPRAWRRAAYLRS